MCGIVGFSGVRKVPASLLMEGLKRLEYRGYDSAGIAWQVHSKIRLRNGQYGVVVRYNRENPFAPIVVIAFDQRNRRIPDEELPEPITLGEFPGMEAASFAGEDLTFLCEGKEESVRRSRIGRWPSLFEAAYP